MVTRKPSACLVYEFLSEQGGLEREIINHANFLKSEGYDVTILTCHLDKKILSDLPFHDLKIRSISKINTSSEFANLFLCAIGFNKIKKFKPDLFITYSFPANFLIRKSNSKKVFYMNHFPHAYYLSFKEKLEWANSTQGIKRWISVFATLPFLSSLRKLDKKLVRNSDLVFTNSNFTKKRLDPLYKINSKVSYPPLAKSFSNVKSMKSDNFIFSSSRIIPDKKYEWLIAAMSLLKRKIPLCLAGSVNESYKKRLLDLASKLNVELIFLGKLKTEKLIEYYAKALVFAFPTPEEDFGLVPAESLSCGTPCVIWGDGAGPTEQIIHGVNGLYAQPYNITDFAEKLELIIKLGLKEKNNKKIVSSSKKFSYEEIEKDFIKEIKKLV